ncbi:LPS export ABC transporter permease LptG [Methylogaea oryzae]|uniref:LPS export ABC transporter permease LptG n=1 Tax=Methylogaea oryzae TaxID=1295382 RepID=UPI0006D13C1D|nr:LPS export ABC transporter permease LptG [Methylogaea oryzae]
MKVLNRYIGAEVVKGSAVAELVLLSLLTFFSFTDEMGDLDKGDYHLRQVFQYLLLMSPRNFYELMPSAALIGSLFTLGGLANHQELVAMRAGGASIRAIIWAVLRAGLLLVAVAVLIGEFIAPKAEQEAQMFRSAAQQKRVVTRTEHGFWLRDQNTYINIGQLGTLDELSNINLYEVDDKHHLKRSMHADKAYYDDEGKWHLQHISRSEFEAERVNVSTTDEVAWSSVLDPALLSVVVINPENLSMYDLARYIAHMRNNSQNSQPYELAFWGRLVTPLSTLVMLFVAVPFILNIRARAASASASCWAPSSAWASICSTRSFPTWR